jgi:hypothetical protein
MTPRKSRPKGPIAKRAANKTAARRHSGQKRQRKHFSRWVR